MKLPKREIKFRVWDKDRKKFAKQITSLKFDRDGNINLVVYLDRVNKTREILDNEKIYCNNFEIMQYTRLKDKNGREIYEGDILYRKYNDSSESVGSVFWGESDQHNEEIQTWCIKLETGVYWVDRSVCEQYEVIGNIYSNPELLRGEEKK